MVALGASVPSEIGVLEVVSRKVNLSHHYEKLTNLGSLGNPSGPILFLANRPSVCILLASSKLTLRLFMIFIISLLLASSNPLLESPPETLPAKSNAEDDNPDSISAWKD